MHYISYRKKLINIAKTKYDLNKKEIIKALLSLLLVLAIGSFVLFTIIAFLALLQGFLSKVLATILLILLALLIPFVVIYFFAHPFITFYLDSYRNKVVTWKQIYNFNKCTNRVTIFITGIIILLANYILSLLLSFLAMFIVSLIIMFLNFAGLSIFTSGFVFLMVFILSIIIVVLYSFVSLYYRIAPSIYLAIDAPGQSATEYIKQSIHLTKNTNQTFKGILGAFITIVLKYALIIILLIFATVSLFVFLHKLIILILPICILMYIFMLFIHIKMQSILIYITCNVYCDLLEQKNIKYNNGSSTAEVFEHNR
ncbi:MAG: hypothetical protein ACK5LT_13680 [Lachnospirales bacterium]